MLISQQEAFKPSFIKVSGLTLHDSILLFDSDSTAFELLQCMIKQSLEASKSRHLDHARASVSSQQAKFGGMLGFLCQQKKVNCLLYHLIYS